MPKYVEINEDEAWAIDHTIRHTYSDSGVVIGRDLLLKVMTLVLEFEERRGKPFAPETLPLALTEDECWAIDHQIRCDLTVNNKPVGRAILLKVFQALASYANERDSESGVQQLGGLADLLSPPAEESTGETHPDEPPQRSDESSGGPAGPRRHPDDGAPGPLPRDK